MVSAMNKLRRITIWAWFVLNASRQSLRQTTSFVRSLSIRWFRTEMTLRYDYYY